MHRGRLLVSKNLTLLLVRAKSVLCKILLLHPREKKKKKKKKVRLG
jgi:hypothetical protein